ncbi:MULTISPECIES: DUF6148 family protein [Bacillaceae]|uniref:DUF6148 family protein n=1 Tax=Bacillaceae TaxID=186817 RepID=UPI001BEB6D0C|nr:DUF6148 family protein [Bacillus sp. ISL-57]MBT2717540.1 hypothetical protein [Bacillus sp. ISL-57]
MNGVTLERAQLHLEAWLDAELAVSTGQSYSMGTRQLTRANLTEISKQIAFWRKEINSLSGQSGKRVMRYIPRDL